MKRLVWLALFPLIASAGGRDDYAVQWPLSLQDDAVGAYRVALDREVYRTAQLPSLRDVDVINADGASVPSGLFAAEQPLAQTPRYLALAWFPLPAGKAAQAQDIAVISERAADGSVRRVETRVSGATDASPRAANAWLIDASHVQEPIVALELQWSSDGRPLDTMYRVEGSNDLRSWRTLQAQGQLLDLVRDGRRLRQRRIPLDGSAKYLRLLPVLDGAAPALTGIRAELASRPAAIAWTWEALRGGERSEQGVTYYEFELDGRFPIERADVALAGNSAGEWTLQSRDVADAPWQTRAGPWVAYRVGGHATDRSAAQVLSGVFRDRYWRLSSRTPPGDVPVLRLGYRPEVLVFVAQGRPPYSLVAGSARVMRADAPVPQLVDALRVQHGEAWQPAAAMLGSSKPLAGDAALTPAPAERDWKAWLLWALLIGGALIVAGFAFSLLRKPPSTGAPD